MARITINDCLTKVNNHFQLVLLATVRAKEILNGKTPTIPRDKSTVAVVALREIAEGTLDIPTMKENLPCVFSDDCEIIDEKNTNSNHNVDGSFIGNDKVIENTDGDTLLSPDDE